MVWLLLTLFYYVQCIFIISFKHVPNVWSTHIHPTYWCRFAVVCLPAFYIYIYIYTHTLHCYPFELFSGHYLCLSPPPCINWWLSVIIWHLAACELSGDQQITAAVLCLRWCSVISCVSSCVFSKLWLDSLGHIYSQVKIAKTCEKPVSVEGHRKCQHLIECN